MQIKQIIPPYQKSEVIMNLCRSARVRSRVAMYQGDRQKFIKYEQYVYELFNQYLEATETEAHERRATK